MKIFFRRLNAKLMHYSPVLPQLEELIPSGGALEQESRNTRSRTEQ